MRDELEAWARAEGRDPDTFAKLECGHDAFSGIDQTDGPEKVWRCDGCGDLFLWVFNEGSDLVGRHVPVAS